MSRVPNKSRTSSLFERACKHEERGQMRLAFRLMLKAAELGDKGAQLNVGNYYTDGTGVRQNRGAALYWYRRAYRRGDSSAAHNMGVLWRNQGKLQRALYWFFRAVKLGNDESKLDVGKHYLHNEKNPRKAIPYFKSVTESDWVTEAGAEEAVLLLREAKKALTAGRRSAR